MQRPEKFGGIWSSRAGDAISLPIEWLYMHKAYALPLEKSRKTFIFNPIVWVEVWFWVNGTCLFPRPLCYLPGHIFRFFVSCTGPEEIIPICTRGSERNNNNNNFLKKPGKKSREIWWNAPKKIWSAIREKQFFCERNPTGLWKQKITNKVRDLIISYCNKYFKKHLKAY